MENKLKSWYEKWIKTLEVLNEGEDERLKDRGPVDKSKAVLEDFRKEFLE